LLLVAISKISKLFPFQPFDQQHLFKIQPKDANDQYNIEEA